MQRSKNIVVTPNIETLAQNLNIFMQPRLVNEIKTYTQYKSQAA
jgi:hypothetical protein